jgi:hypothetical protein
MVRIPIQGDLKDRRGDEEKKEKRESMFDTYEFTFRWQTIPSSVMNGDCVEEWGLKSV